MTIIVAFYSFKGMSRQLCLGQEEVGCKWWGQHRGRHAVTHACTHAHTHLALLENPVNPEDVVKHFIEQY